jgi:hypothetical protein
MKKKEKIKTAEGNHALMGMTEPLAAVQSFGLSEIARCLRFFAAACQLISRWEIVKGQNCTEMLKTNWAFIRIKELP